MPKQRVDQLLVERGLAESRARAQALVMAGLVFSGEKRIEKPGVTLAAEAPLAVKGKPHPWVSRGGVKLAHALEHFGIDPGGAVCLDIGASTGGFTEVLLAKGAAKVYAVDVGHGQLDWSLRNDKRVVVLERTNARHLTRAQVPEPADLVVCDASFIGLRTILPAPLALTSRASGEASLRQKLGPLAERPALVALIKPQFEAGPDKVGKGGIVRDEAVRAEVCETIRAWLAAQPGWQVLGVTESPIEGADGNKEFLIAARKA